MKEFIVKVIDIFKQSDKLLHLSAGFVLMSIFSALFHLCGMCVVLTLVFSYVITALFGAGKEIFDKHNEGHCAEWYDFIAVLIGGFASLVCCLILML